VRDLIEARTGEAARLSARRLEGRLSHLLAQVREDLVSAAAGLSATIDFSEDVGEAVSPETLSRIEAAAETLGRLAASYETGRLLSAGCRVAIVGRPNAGKSTPFNALRRQRARSSPTCLTTRDTLHATADVRGIPVELRTRLACGDRGHGRANRVLRAWEAGETSDMVLYVFDAAVGWTPEDAAALARFDGAPALLIANKIDRLSGRPDRRAARRDAVSGISPEAAEAPRLPRSASPAMSRPTRPRSPRLRLPARTSSSGRARRLPDADCPRPRRVARVRRDYLTTLDAPADSPERRLRKTLRRYSQPSA
jgi:tRNA U34 5-carboxymethylaminomethyl modifying GTPase MnmE/TrmE